MRYQVLWTADAEHELARIWVDSSNRGAVTRAALVIDERLASSAPQEGESRPLNQRIILESPLGALFEFSERDRTAHVIVVWEFRLH